MSTLLALLGIDVAMRSLVACLLLSEKEYIATFENTPEGFAALLCWALAKAEGAALRAGVEATGSYHKALCRFLEEHGHFCLVLNPKQVRDLANGLGISCKTDKADASVIAQVLGCSKVKCQAQRNQLHDDLRDISRQIQNLTDLTADTRHRMNTPSRCQQAKDSDAALIAFCKLQVKQLEAAWLELLKKAATLQEKYQHQLSLPRIGPKTARVAISELPEESCSLTVKQISRYSGLTPCLKESGETRHHAFIQGGNAHLRKAFYMPALSASFLDEECKKLYVRLRAKGRTHKVAVTAVMHKLIRRSAAVHIRHAGWTVDKS
jgi:transposase